MPEYCFFAQPIENIKTGRVIVYELLLREWNSEERLWQRPDTFELPADTLIKTLDNAIRDLHFHRVSINLTNQQFANMAIMRALTAYVSTHMVPRQLTIELVETPDFDVLKKMSVYYRSAGMLIAIDDVGSDNLYARVKDMLPYVNTVKFALQNMRRLGEPTSPETISSLRFWFNRAEEQQMLFTFEGIENEDDVSLARSIGISRGQGYYFAKPQLPVCFCS
ncbi:EAL domain-containing protein [Lacticaseibacillus hulanensis]|uniref:EAL domain-containing protein n=1 Tax=Lacticaseibacillus hulanensis TaxID=2493111 RepID=UPI000FDBF4A1|nr:EAL domain-containing protein [Lacticaseibacillus hulanensis]